MIKKYFLPLWMLFCLFVGNAQPKRLCFEHLNIRNGLPSDHVRQILQDEKGYIWLNTITSLSRYDGYKFKVYKLGADQNETISDAGIFFDRNKRLWVGTDYGNLFRLDGVRDTLLHERYAPNKERISGFYFFFSDKQNKIWHFRFSYRARAQFLEQYDPDSKRTRRFNPSQKENEFLDSGLIMTYPFTTTSGDIYFGSLNGFYEYNFKKDNFDHYLDFPDSLRRINVIDFAETKSDTSVLWLLAKNRNQQQCTLYLFNKHDKTLKACTTITGTVERFAKSLYEDKKGRLWLAFKEGLYRYNRQSNDTVGYLFPPSDKFAKEQYYAEVKVDDRKGYLWLKTFFGVLYFNTSTGEFQRYMANPSDPDALAHNHITDIHEDRSGLIWVGMDEYGVDRVNDLKSSFRTLKYNSLQPGSYPENTTGLAQRSDGNYWVTSMQGVFEWDTKKNYFKKVKLKLQNKDEIPVILHPVCLKNGDLYFTNYVALYKYAPTGKLERFKPPGNNDANWVFDDSNEELWLLSAKGTLYQFDPASHSFSLYPFINMPGTNSAPDTVGEIIFPWALYEDRQRVLWMSTSKAGLCRVDRAKKTVITSPSLQGSIFKDIIQMYEDVEGNFWIGTKQNGLWLFDRKTSKLVKQIIDKDGVLKRIAGITEDRSGNLWVLSERGVTKFDYKNNVIFNYTTVNNIPFDAPISLTKTNSGELLLCMFNSLMRFNPDEIKPNPVPPVVQFESMVYSNPQSKQPDEHLVSAFNQTDFKLPYYHNRVTFNFVALHYVNSLQNQYAYKLDGFDNNWVESGTQHKVSYNNLDHGTYKFHVKAANSDGVWSTKDVFVTVIISPPWWKTWWAYCLYALLFITGVYVTHTIQKRNVIRAERERTKDRELAQAKEIEKAYHALKSTQAQLIQSEKMASLGELTAGIAHEIQNPLNFVNNFSEVNTELIDELKNELLSDNKEGAISIADDLKDNEQKILHHGKRADAIVKGMLQHSRLSTGQKEPTDINALADEYLRLSYHGMRAKDKAFNATLQTDFDTTIGKIKVVPQDIGRVLLNLFNNAFYAVQQKKNLTGFENLSGLNSYEPKVEVCTKSIKPPSGGLGIEIIIKDNGIGIPQKVVDKIFQPFFTTKPTGQGTGLGLSLAYDIIKAHGGELKVETKEGEGSDFKIILPQNNA